MCAHSGICLNFVMSGCNSNKLSLRLTDCANLLVSLVGEKIGIIGSLRLCFGVALFEKEAPRLGSARLDAGD